MSKFTWASSGFCVIGLKKMAANCGALILLTLASLTASAQATQNIVGFWYKPSESGWGLSIQQQGTSTFGVWFTYDLQGATTFNTIQCTFTGNTCAGDIFTYTGIPLAQISTGANAVAAKIGTGAIVTTGSNRLSLSYTIGSVQQTKVDLEPQNFAAASMVPQCTLQLPLTSPAYPPGTDFRSV